MNISFRAALVDRRGVWKEVMVEYEWGKKTNKYKNIIDLSGISAASVKS